MPNLDPEAAFESMKSRVAATLHEQFPFEGSRRRLELVNVVFDERAANPNDPHHVDNLESQLRARTENGTWGVRVRAHLRLIDKANGAVLEDKTVTLAKLPKLTKRYSYIIEGQERQHDSLFRSKSRPYHLITGGGKIMGRWNLARGKGFDINYDPKTGRMLFHLPPSSNVPLYSLLNILGVSDAHIESAWGHEIFIENQRISVLERDVNKLFRGLSLRFSDHRATSTLEDKIGRLRQYFQDETEVRPEASAAAFGRSFSNVNGENLLLSSKRLLGIQHGRTKDDPSSHEQPDDRQSLSAKYLATTEDFVVEGIRGSHSELMQKVRDKIDNPKRGIDDIVGNLYDKVILGRFSGAQRPDQTNPLQFLSGYMRTTIRGEYGGVTNPRTNLDLDKQINPTHLGFLDPIQTPESQDTGIALHLPLGIAVTRAPEVPGSKSRMSSGQEIRTKVYDMKSRTMVMATPDMLEHAIVAYPDQVRWVDGHPVPISTSVVCYDEERKTSKRPWSRVRYVLPSSKALFSFSANLVPFLQNNSGNRAMTGTKQQEQAVSLVDREAPLVQVKTDGSPTFEHVVGEFASHRSPVAGTVTKIEPGAVHVEKTDGTTERVQVYNHFPLNGGKGGIHAHPVVGVGQKVKKGDLLADTNFTRGGALALGTNLRVAYVPWKGLNFEDGIVISETAAKKMTSARLHQEQMVIYPGMIGAEPGASSRWADYSPPERRTPARLQKLDMNGIIKEGSTVHPGDVLVAALSPAKDVPENRVLDRIGKGMARPYRDAALVWDHDYDGTVVRVLVQEAMGRKTITLHVSTTEPLVVGDKLTGRHGNKGIISRIVPDHLMPHTQEGTHVDVLLNPAGVPSRMNVGQVLETAASKVAEKTGKPYVVENFVPGVDYTAKVKRDLAKHGLTDTEELFDPETGRSIGQIMTGKQYMLRLHHDVDKKMTALSFGKASRTTGEPPSGAGIPGGGQTMDPLTVYAMLAHGARNNLEESFTFKSDGDQDAVWGAIMAGHPLPSPQPTKGMKNFQSYLRAMGVNTEKKGDVYTLGPMTDAHIIGDKEKGIRGISNGAIRLPEKLTKARGMRTLEETGGLFDPRVTGGLEGTYWSHVRLAERMPNPMFEGAIQALTGTTAKQYASLTGPHLQDGKSGFHVLVDKLSRIDVEKELVKERAALKTAKKADLAKTLKRVRYLEALKEQGLTPLEAYTNQYLPVLPPAARPLIPGIDGRLTVDDRNKLYAAIGAQNALLESAPASMPRDKLQESRAELYQTIRGLRLTGAAETAGRPRHLVGLMEMLSGKVEGSGAPKESYFQEHVVSRRQFLSGRSTIVPEPNLHLDEVGIPLPVAMEMYRPFVVRELVRGGMDVALANKKVQQEKDSRQVVAALHRAVESRPVMLKRDPALHKFSILAFHPKITEGKAIKLHPLVTGGFNADFDGDTMAMYVPVSESAVAESHKMLPSANLFSPTTFGLMTVPGQDSLLGLYQATKWGKEVTVPPGTTHERIVQLMEDGKLKPSDVVLLGSKKTTAGRLALAAHLPPDMRGDDKLLHDPHYQLDKGTLQTLLTRIAKSHEKDFPRVVDAWKDLGNKLAYLNGSSFSLEDFHDGKTFRDEILRDYRDKEHALHATPMTSKKRDQALVKIYDDAREELKTRGTARYNQRDNRLWEWAQAKARGNWDQFSQLVFGPMLVEDSTRKKVPVPITKSYGEGLSVSEYWAAMHGARKGTLDRVQGTQEPGAVTKDIINTVMPIHITSEDCGTTNGVTLSPSDRDAVDRYLAHPVKLEHEIVPAGVLLTPSLAQKITTAGVPTVVVRSPLHCRMPEGICAKCFGHNEHGRLHSVGTNIGVIAGHAMGEPITQLTMKAFHTGGASGTGSSAVDSFQRVKQLLTLPGKGKLPNAATLAEVSGHVDKVTPDQRGGSTVVIAGKAHRVVTGKVFPHIRPGAVVQKGDTLSTGPVNPHELLEQTRSMNRVRDYMTEELMHKDLYGGLGVRRRNVETVVRGLTNLARVNAAPDESPYLRGQVTQLSELEAHNDTAHNDGRPLVSFEPHLRAINQVPLAGSEDWLARLNYQQLAKTYTEGAAQHWKSDVTKHPIPGIAHGVGFGRRQPRVVAPPPARSAK